MAAEASLRMANPWMQFEDPESKKPLSGGALYVGITGQDPTVAANQKRVYLLQEDGSAIPIGQPISLGAGGVPIYNGSPAVLGVDGDYSIAVHDSSGAQVYYHAAISGNSLQDVGNPSIIEDSATLASAQTVVTFPRVDLHESIVLLNVLGSTGSVVLQRDVDYTITSGATGTLTLTTSYAAGSVVSARQNVFTSQDLSFQYGIVYPFATVADAVIANLVIGDHVQILGDSTYDDGLAFDKYVVVAGGTGTNDGINFINMTNGLQLQALKSRAKLKTYTETVTAAALASGTLTLDAEKGSVQTVTLTESVGTITFANIQAGESTSFTLFVKQDGTGGRGISFSGLKGSGSVGPVLSTGANEEDVIVFVTYDGSTWYVFQSAQDAGIIP